MLRDKALVFRDEDLLFRVKGLAARSSCTKCTKSLLNLESQDAVCDLPWEESQRETPPSTPEVSIAMVSPLTASLSLSLTCSWVGV